MGTTLGNNDVKTGIKSAVQSLGTNNPFTITTVGEVSTTAVAVQGGEIVNQYEFKLNQTLQVVHI